jgi:hypothetical protein
MKRQNGSNAQMKQELKEQQRDKTRSIDTNASSSGA